MLLDPLLYKVVVNLRLKGKMTLRRKKMRDQSQMAMIVPDDS